MRYLLASMILIAAAGSSVNSYAAFNQYAKTHLIITNKTKYDELVRIHGTEGQWERPVTEDVMFILKPGEIYKNTLKSINGSHGYGSYSGISVIRENSPRENYLSYGQYADNDRHETFCDIFDGLGDMFVSSWMNHCRDKAADGYPLCKLDVMDNS